MQSSILVFLLSLIAVAYPLFAIADDCTGQIPDYIMEGNKDMDETKNAEQILCADNTKNEVWNGKLNENNQNNTIKDKKINSEDFNNAIAKGINLKFENCQFKKGINISKSIKGSLSFDKCEFESDININQSVLQGAININQSVLHNGISVSKSIFIQSFTISNSIIASNVDIDNSSFLGGVKFENIRINGDWTANGFQSPIGLSVVGSRFLKKWSMIDPEITGSVNFRDTFWSEDSLIKFENGTISGGLSFYRCSFNYTSDTDNHQFNKSQLRLSNITIGTAVVLSDIADIKLLNNVENDRTDIKNNFPTIKVERSLIPLLKLPAWSIANSMIITNSDEEGEKKQLEPLQLAYKGYVSAGNLKDALATRKPLRLGQAKTNGTTAYILLRATFFFVDFVYWILSIILLVPFVIFLYKGKSWLLVGQHDGLFLHIYKCVDLSLTAFIKGTPEDSSLQANTPEIAKWIMRVERIFGVLFLFFLSLAITEWLSS